MQTERRSACIHQTNLAPCSVGQLALGRRDFLKLIGLGSASALAPAVRTVAGPFGPAEFEKLVPADKKLQPEWVKSLFERGVRTKYRWPESKLIGMPIGGICSGQLYLGGDGKLWHWDIFNEVKDTGSSGPHYANPLQPSSPLDQGFALRIDQKGRSHVRPLDHTGWREIEFTGEYPIGFIEYRDTEAPVSVSMEAFSPFIPLNPEDSALPATIMRFTVKNTSSLSVVAELAGWLENAVCLNTGQLGAGLRRNRIMRRDRFTFLECSAENSPQQRREAKRPDVVFDDFEGETYAGWTNTGTAFGMGPVEQDRMPDYQGKVGAHDHRLVNSHASAPGNTVTEKDAATGLLLSKPFVIERDFITFLIGGGGHKSRTCFNLIVDGKTARTATGRNDNRLAPHTWDVCSLAGQPAQLQIVDNEKGPWGNIGIDQVVFTDEPRTPVVPFHAQPDFGTMGLALLNDESQIANRKSQLAQDLASASLPAASIFSGVFSGSDIATAASATKPFGEKLAGSLARKFELAPGESATVTFAITWHFPNISLGGLSHQQGRWYGKKFIDALAVAEYVTEHLERLASETRRWHDTWYDSTLPHWFLDRTFLNASILATNTCYWFGNGRFYGWEGVGCCAGTCTHVWHYAHAVARLFPQLERSLREIVDFGVAFDPETGRIRFRAEHNNHWAVDGQAGVILRTYREHQTSADDALLRRLWPRVKKALEFLMGKDDDRDGILDGPQHNTLDADWQGQVAWLSGLYLTALRAGEEMASEMDDDAFARRCREVFEKGRRAIDEKLFNGEYYFQLGDPARTKTVGSYDGCEIDQVFGDSWAWQVGLGRILNEEKVKTALRSLWRYNFTPDIGPYRAAYKPGRWYARAGEGGLLMCTWPRGETRRVKESFDYYFNECMTGFEYQAAWHMIAEGMVLEGLAITRMIHDRYHASRRNPWNEVECGDHYARAMASYGVFLAACGFEYHGPKRHLGFAPRLTPDNFRAAFTTAEGWGTFSQQSQVSNFRSQIAIRWGQLRLRTLSVVLHPGFRPTRVTATVAGRPAQATLALQAGKVTIELESEALLAADDSLQIELS